MKTIFLSLIFIFSFKQIFSQGGVWTWISGDTTLGSLGVYGTQGVPSVNNYPPGLYEYSEWKDNQGNFWIYGGWNPSYNDLWKYNPLTNEWTWVKGTATINQLPVYGVMGVPDPANTPGGRAGCSATWVDTVGNLWLFGGYNNSGQKNDLWKYDINTNEWTWMKGDITINPIGIHGTKGIPSALNKPGGRSETSSAWTDSLNNLWLFGGAGYNDVGSYGRLNDLMKYNIGTNEWTWMSGSTACYAPNVFGVRGISNPANIPGGRITYTKWKDKQGNFWLMGGVISSWQNDVWKYNPQINEWTWVAGSSQYGDIGNYFSNCHYDSLNNPPCKAEHRSAVTDNCGRFWLYAGATESNFTIKYLNDLWVFDPLISKWKLVYGSYIFNQQANYGVIGIPSATNIPPAAQGAVAWWGNDNRFYQFGGNANNTGPNFGTLWVFMPDSLCFGGCNFPYTAFNAAGDSICPGSCVSFLNLSANATSFHWSFQGGSPDTSTAINPSDICYANPGSYSVTLIASNANGSDTLTLQNYITVFPQPPAQSITQSGDTLFAISGSSSYQWYFNGNLISGATDYFYVATTSGDYNVVATDSNGCEVEAVINNVLANAQAAVGSSSRQSIQVYPNPVIETLYIRGLKNNSVDEIKIFNVFGEKVFSAVNCQLSAQSDPSFGGQIANCQFLPSGLYYIEITSDKKIYRTKFVKQ